jgi:predicted permease
MIGDWIQDVRYALRGLRRSPGFTLTAVVTLGVGIGANTAIFALLDRLLLRPLPVAAPERLVQVVTDRGENGVNYNLSLPAVEVLREERAAFTGVLASTPLSLGLSGPHGTTQIPGAAVSGDYFTTLGLTPAAGRWFTIEEAVFGRPEQVAVVSHGFWVRSLAADAGALGRDIRLNDRPFTVIGVAPAGFDGLVRGGTVDVWVPLSTAPLLNDMGSCPERPGCSWLDVFARLAPGVSRETAAAALAAGDAARIAAGSQFEGERRVLRDGAAGLVFRVGVVEKPLTILMAAVGVLLVIACGNVAALLLVRARGRRRELAVRLALGAGRARLTRQLLTESILLAGLGGTLGLLIAGWSAGFLAGYRAPGGAALVVASGLDGRVLAFAALVSCATVLLFGLVPAFGGSRTALAPALKDALPNDGRGRRWALELRDGLVIGQVALAVVLVVGAALLVRTVRNLGALDVGFDPVGVVLADLDVEMRQYDRPRTVTFYQSVQERVAALPGVTAATVATTVWPNPGGWNWGGLRLEGFAGTEDEVSFDVNQVGPDYFGTLGIPLVAGRALDRRDDTGPLVAVINETMARRYWPAGDALGRRIYRDSTTAIEVVGIARDGKYRDLREAPQATLFLPFAQVPRPSATLLVRAAGDPLALVPALRAAVTAVDPGVPVFDLRTLETHVGFARARERLAADVVAVFGAVSLGLAALGLYGVLADGVRQRTREIGVRVALGARPADVTGLFLRRATGLVAAGAALGGIGALAATRLVRDLLFGVASADPASFLAAAGALVGAGLLAAFLPARRAARLDPMEALRHE